VAVFHSEIKTQHTSSVNNTEYLHRDDIRRPGHHGWLVGHNALKCNCKQKQT